MISKFPSQWSWLTHFPAITLRSLAGSHEEDIRIALYFCGYDYCERANHLIRHEVDEFLEQRFSSKTIHVVRRSYVNPSLLAIRLHFVPSIWLGKYCSWSQTQEEKKMIENPLKRFISLSKKKNIWKHETSDMEPIKSSTQWWFGE